jgi:hypothetical protein
LKYDDTEKLLAGCYSFMRKESGTKPGAWQNWSKVTLLMRRYTPLQLMGSMYLV